MWTHGTCRKGEKKAYRPLQVVKKRVPACVRYSRADLFAIRERASKAGLKASEYIRQITLKRPGKNPLTQKINKAGSFLDIKLLDHLMLTEEAYFSCVDEGLL